MLKLSSAPLSYYCFQTELHEFLNNLSTTPYLPNFHLDAKHYYNILSNSWLEHLNRFKFGLFSVIAICI